MHTQRSLRILFAIGLGFALLLALRAGLGASAAVAAVRPLEPAVVPGAALPAFTGAPLDELVLYAYNGGAWAPIPFQIDEVTASGVYTSTEDGLLDGNDELVFMGGDAGEPAGPAEWAGGDEARVYPRYAITVADALIPGAAGYAYLYRSTTLTRTAERYVSWDQAAQMVSASAYTLTLGGADLIGIAGMSINDAGVDLIDRQKIRVTVDNPFPIPDVTLTEAELVRLLGVSEVTLTITGPVRAAGGDGTSAFALYGARVEARVVITSGRITLPISRVRISLDWNDPATTGMAPAVYYDGNTPGGVPVDGVPDAVPVSPPVSWYQVAGSLGAVVTALDVDAGDDALFNYYRDDSHLVPADTGDDRSFADAGMEIERTGDGLDGLAVTQTAYILPPGSAGSLLPGAAVVEWAHTPLAVTAALQLPPGAGQPLVYLPLIRSAR